jgi:putative FmdB family regulatory protein
VTKFDIRCDTCDHRWEEVQKYEDTPGECPECGSNFTTVLLTMAKQHKAKDPYDMLDGPIPDAKKIKSFARDRRKGGRG